jgi:predicted phage tail protein
MATVGLALALGGIAQIISPVAKDNLSDKDGKNETQRMFNGPVNVVTQGGPIPLVYGRKIVGSVVGSAGIHIDAVAFTGPGNGQNPEFGG